MVGGLKLIEKKNDEKKTRSFDEKANKQNEAKP